MDGCVVSFCEECELHSLLGRLVPDLGPWSLTAKGGREWSQLDRGWRSEFGCVFVLLHRGTGWRWPLKVDSKHRGTRGGLHMKMHRLLMC